MSIYRPLFREDDERERRSRTTTVVGETGTKYENEKYHDPKLGREADRLKHD